MLANRYDNLITKTFGGSIKNEFSLNVQVECPQCGKMKLYIHREKGVCHCFSCEYSADAVRLIQDLEGCTYAEALQSLKKIARGASSIKQEEGGYNTAIMIAVAEVYGSVPTKALHEEEELPLPDGCVDIKGTQGDLYMKKRGFRNDILAAYQLRYCEGSTDNNPDPKDYVIFPDYYPTDLSKTRFWTSRAAWDTKPYEMKSIHPAGAHKPLYGLWRVPSAQKGVIVVEGPIDCLALGDGHAVAILGKTITDGQCQELAARFKWAVICLDSEAVPETFETARRVQRHGIEAWVSILPSGDPGDLVRMGKNYVFGGKKPKRKEARPETYVKSIAERYSPGLQVKYLLEKARRSA